MNWVRKLRKNAGLSQFEFWGRIGMYQSNGSRLEHAKRYPSLPIRRLLLIAYGTKAQSLREIALLRSWNKPALGREEEKG